MSLPQGVRVFSCSCAENGELWASTDQGGALVRKGITRATPTGTGWIGVEQPRERAGIREISMGRNAVWVVDYEAFVFYRAGVSEKAPQGTRWVDLSSVVTNVCRITSLSVSQNNQVSRMTKNKPSKDNSRK